MQEMEPYDIYEALMGALQALCESDAEVLGGPVASIAHRYAVQLDGRVRGGRADLDENLRVIIRRGVERLAVVEVKKVGDPGDLTGLSEYRTSSPHLAYIECQPTESGRSRCWFYPPIPEARDRLFNNGETLQREMFVPCKS